jgi:hypothetical protein
MSGRHTVTNLMWIGVAFDPQSAPKVDARGVNVGRRLVGQKRCRSTRTRRFGSASAAINRRAVPMGERWRSLGERRKLTSGEKKGHTSKGSE